MIGFDISAITANNGWAMALTGAVIVMTGLASLSLIISQLHKIIALFGQKPPASEAPLGPPGTSFAQRSAEVDILNDLAAAARIYQSLTMDLTESFELAKLYALCEKELMPHPHLTIRALRDAGYLVATGKGTYRWNES